jgi:hypothetical protein
MITIRQANTIITKKRKRNLKTMLESYNEKKIIDSDNENAWMKNTQRNIKR